MSNIEKENLVKQIKLAKIFKGIIVVGMIASVLISAAACKEALVVEEQQIEEKGEVTIPSETKETTPPIIETPTVIEDEGVVIPPIEGLRYDKESNTFFAEAGNPYGLEVGEKAGVFVKDAVEINEVMKPGIGLVPKVLEVMQKKIMEEKKEFRYAFPINFEEAKGIKIKEAEFHESRQTPEENRIFDKDTRLEISNVPLNTIIYVPSTTLTTCGGDVLNMHEGSSFFRFDIVPGLFKEDIINNYKLDWSKIKIVFHPKGVEFISKEIEKELTQWKKIVESDWSAEPPEIETKMGTPLIKVIDKVNLMEEEFEKDLEEKDIWYFVGLKPTDFQMMMYYAGSKGSWGDADFKAGVTGLRNLLEIGEMKIFILPVYD